MKILVIMKRFGANKDMVQANFGRQIRLFEPLSKKHKIDFLCPDYIKKDKKVINKKGIRYFIEPLSLLTQNKLKNRLKNLIKKESYDLIAGTTDPLIGILANKYAKKYKIKFLYDLQDNFEIYDSYKLPFVSHLDKKAMKNADILITVSESLKKKISKFRKNPIYVLQNGIENGLFKTIDKIKARKKLDLPKDKKIITYIGHIEKLKGYDVMKEAFEKVTKKYPDSILLLSGKVEKGINLKNPNFIYKEFPKREQVVLAINASDVVLIPNSENKFTKYCFPYKLAEYMSCNVPIVATDIGDVSLILKKYKGSLCKPNDSEDMSKKILNKLMSKSKVNYDKDVKNLSWAKLSEKLDKVINKIR